MEKRNQQHSSLTYPNGIHDNIVIYVDNWNTKS